MTTTIEVCTGHISRPGGIDISARTLDWKDADETKIPGGWLLAPMPWFERQRKRARGGLKWREFEKRYTDVLRMRFAMRAPLYGAWIEQLAARGDRRIVLTCDCKASLFKPLECHRAIAAGILITVGNGLADKGLIDVRFTDGGELDSNHA